MFKAKGKKTLTLLGPYGFPPHPWGTNRRDVLIVRCDGFMDKRIPMKNLGMERPLREIEKEEDKAFGADPHFWPKYWKNMVEGVNKEKAKKITAS